MSILIAVDPGVHACGVADYLGGQLVFARLVPSIEAPLQHRLEHTQCICEQPQVYYGRGRGRASDLVDVAIAAGRMTALLPTKYVLPAEWKGQVPKPIHHKRVWKALGASEPEAEALADQYTAMQGAKKTPPPMLADRHGSGSPEVHCLIDCLRGIAPSLRHNVMDAVALGLRTLGRI